MSSLLLPDADGTGFDALDYGFIGDNPAGKPISGERRLWCAVLVQALVDAERGDRSALRWLTDDSEDKHDICLMAGVSPHLLREAAARMKEPAALS